MKIRIRTLTPIWTGGVNGKCTKLRETSIIGSLRWWFEAIVRGFGGYACDSVGEVTKKCELNVEEYKKGARPEELVCPVCYVFGTTGWSRRFRLEIDERSYQMVTSNLAISGLRCKCAPYHRNVKQWFELTLGNVTPKVIVENNSNGIAFNILANNVYVESTIYLVLKTIEKFGALGSHNSYGFGIIKVLEPLSNIEIDDTLNFIEKYIKKYCRKHKCNENMKLRFPNLKFIFKIDFKLLNGLPNKNIGFILKYTLRNKFKEKKEEYGKNFAEQLFGSKKDRREKFSGKIFVSNCWEEGGNYFFRVYGMLPPVILGSRKKEDIIKTIEECIEECLDGAKVVAKNIFDLGENEYIDKELFKRLVMKNV